MQLFSTASPLLVPRCTIAPDASNVQMHRLADEHVARERHPRASTNAGSTCAFCCAAFHLRSLIWRSHLDRPRRIAGVSESLMGATLLGGTRGVWQPCAPSCSGRNGAAAPLPCHKLGRGQWVQDVPSPHSSRSISPPRAPPPPPPPCPQKPPRASWPVTPSSSFPTPAPALGGKHLNCVSVVNWVGRQ